MGNFDENISFQRGSDTGQANAASVVPVTDSEAVWSGTTNRPIENLRARTEILRRAVQTTLYYQDYDRGLVLRSEGKFSLTEPVPGSERYVLTATDDLWIFPPLTPGRASGGRWGGGRAFFNGLPYLGASAAAALTFTAATAYTGQRGYFDGDTLATSTVFSVGANRITIELIQDAGAPTGTFVFTVTGAPATKVTVTYGAASGAPTHAALIAAFNADTSSQGLYGVANLLHAESTAVDPSSNVVIEGSGLVQGAYDAEAHCVTFAQFQSFFSSVVDGDYVNRLIDGEGLGVAFPAGPVEPFGVSYPKGGRRQSIFDLPTNRAGASVSNVTPLTSVSLFSTGREPEKIPGSVPIGKLVKIGSAVEFIFIDGTRVRLGEAPVALGESRVSRALFSSTTPGSSGASLVGYDGSTAWNPNAIVAPTALPSGTVEAALDAVVTQLGGYAATTGGARRIGFEPIDGVATSGNVAFGLNGVDPDSVDVRSVQIAISRLLNQAASPTESGGLNSRVSEYGHRMHGFAPLEKVFSETGPTDLTPGGAQFLRAVHNVPTNSLADSQPEELALAWLKPFKTPLVGALLPVVPAGGPYDNVLQTALSPTAMIQIKAQLAIPDAGGPLHCVAKLYKTTGDLADGYYYVSGIDAAAGQISLVTLSGRVAPDLTGIGTQTKLTLYQANLHGNSAEGFASRHTIGDSTAGAVHAYFGTGRINAAYDPDGRIIHTESATGALWDRLAVTSRVTTGSGANTTTGAADPAWLRVQGLTGMTHAALTSRFLYIVSASDPALIGTWPIENVVSATEVDISGPDPSLTGVTTISWQLFRNGSRDTGNIPIIEDANLLKGLETGFPVNATPNHHHGDTYTKIHPYAGTGLALYWFYLGVATATVDSLSSGSLHGGDYAVSDPTFLLSGFTLLGLFVEITVTVVTSAGASGTAWGLRITSSPGTSYNVSDARNVFHVTGNKVNSGSDPDTITQTLRVFVTTSAAGEFFLQATASGTVSTGASTVVVRPVEGLFSR